MIHPVTFRYHFIGAFHTCCNHSLDLLESHLNWEPQTNLPLLERIGKVAEGLLAERELAYWEQNHQVDITNVLKH